MSAIHRSMLYTLLFGAVLTGLAHAGASSASAAPPNFLVILADDLGYSDIGSFGGEIETPNLDQLAAEGLRMTGFHVASTCSPTRSMLLTGTDHHLAGIANMKELITPSQRGKPGYEGHLNDRVVTIAEVLSNNGYRTVMSGKWHLGATDATDPYARGFSRVFTLREGGHNHFGKPGLPPAEMGGANYTEDGRKVSLPEDFYSSDYFTDKLVQFLGEDRQQPFFAYLPFTAPHWPLHAPAETIAKYKGHYDQGWEVLLKKRLARQQALGLLPANADLSLPATLRDWESLSDEERRRQSRKMEIYAAMVDRMDWNIGRVIQALRDDGRLDNTVVIFLSDNGAAPDTLAGMLAKVDDFAPLEEGAFEDWGSADSMLAYGPNWAQAASAPYRLYKSTTAEGGLMSPTIIRYPGFVNAGGTDRRFATAMDLVPTFLEMAGAQHPAKPGGKIEPVRGKSLLPLLTGDAGPVHSDSDAVGWELFGQRALRQGDWKATYLSEPNGPGRWALFNLARDPGEREDLAATNPQKLAALVALWDAYAEEMGIILEEQVVSPYTNL
ncbi:MAG TPA: arylsulfatase [Spongiibacteraceae bacterium]|nr:arylsulfatase [Spongiibacteraceae bacterium]HUH38072.1 arylsulfatase [Spongiibacteraceae bacterium]